MPCNNCELHLMEINNTNCGYVGNMANDIASVWKDGNAASANISILWANAARNITTITANGTRYSIAPEGWTPWLVGAIAVFIVSFLLNLIALIFQCLPQIHISSFTVYLIVIFITNILHLSVVRPLGTLQTLSGKWLLGNSLCVVYMYFLRVISVIPPLFHVLISLNRLWAIQYPMLYRQYHNKKIAVLLCIGMVGYVHVVPFPAFLVDVFYFNPPEKLRDCQVMSGAMIPWNRTEFVLDRLIPVVIVISVYIYIMVKRLQEKGGKAGMVQPAIQMNAGSSINTVSARISKVSKEQENPVIRHVSGVRRKKVKPFIVLTMTSISVFVCWIPADVYWFYMAYLSIRLPNIIYNVTSTLFSLQMIFDPLMWYFSLR